MYNKFLMAFEGTVFSAKKCYFTIAFFPFRGRLVEWWASCRRLIHRPLPFHKPSSLEQGENKPEPESFLVVSQFLTPDWFFLLWNDLHYRSTFKDLQIISIMWKNCYRWKVSDPVTHSICAAFTQSSEIWIFTVIKCWLRRGEHREGTSLSGQPCTKQRRFYWWGLKEVIPIKRQILEFSDHRCLGNNLKM